MTNRQKYIERILRDAKTEGRIKAVGKKLHSVDVNALSKELQDTTSADFSKNQFAEAPYFLCLLSNLEELNLSYNLIRHVHDDFSFLQNLSHLDLSCNCLTEVPKCLCSLEFLEIFLLRNNRICTVPAEVSGLLRLIELDLSSNLLTSLPREIEEIKSLRILILRQNLLLQLPEELTRLSLRILDISHNRLSTLASSLQQMYSLENLMIEGNPLIYPPIDIQVKGIHHIFKSLRKNQTFEKDVVPEQDLKKRIALTEFTNRLGRRYLRLRTNQPRFKKTNDDSHTSSEMTDSGYGGSARNLGYHADLSVSAAGDYRSATTRFSLGGNSLPRPVLEEDSSIEEEPRMRHRRPSRPRSAAPRPVGIIDDNVIDPPSPPPSPVTSCEPVEVEKTLSADLERSVHRIAEIIGQNSGLTLAPHPAGLLRQLRQGRLLCDLINTLRPGLVRGAAGHPSRGYLDLFLGTCCRLGVSQSCICTAEDVLTGSTLAPLEHTLVQLMERLRHPSPSDHCIALFCAALFLSTLIALVIFRFDEPFY